MTLSLRENLGIECAVRLLELLSSSKILGKYSTIFQAEVSAILACANSGIAKRYTNKHIVILSDGSTIRFLMHSISLRWVTWSYGYPW